MGRRDLNTSVKFLDAFRVTQHVGSCVDYTPNIFVHSWGVYPTDTITANVSTITRRAYDPIRSFHGLVLRSNHERLSCLLESVKISVTMLLPMFVHPLMTPWVMHCPMIPTPMTAGLTDKIPTDKLLIPSKMGVSVIGSLLASNCLLDSLIVSACSSNS